MRKIIIFILFCISIVSMTAQNVKPLQVYPEIWHKPDTLVSMPNDDSIAWTDEYTLFAVVRSMKADSTECLWGFTENDTVAYAVLSDGIYTSPTGVLHSHSSRDFSRWCVYAYHSGIHADSSKFRSLRLGKQTIYNPDSMRMDTLDAEIEMEELAYFKGNVSKLASESFQTYLALKYGITLDYAAYISPTGDTLLHPEDDEDYYFRVIGIGYDTAHDWRSTMSQSKEEAVMHISTDTLSPNEYILMGDDNGAAEWHQEPDGTYSMRRTWRIKQTVRQPKDIVLSLPLSALGNETDSLWLVLSDRNGVEARILRPDSIGVDSVCYFTLDRMEDIMHVRLGGTIADPSNSKRQIVSRKNSSVEILYDTQNRTLIINGFPENQVFVLYLYDNTGKFLSNVSGQSPIDVSMLPNAVFYIEITADNRIIGAIPVPANIY